MAVWGLVVAIIATLALVAMTPKTWTTYDGRGAALREALVMVEHGGPLLVGRYHGVSGAYYELKEGDDQGVYVYVPLLSHLFGVSDPVAMLRYLYLALIALTAAVYPLVFYRLTGTLLAGAAAPIMFVVCMMSMGWVDIYWIPAWGALTFVPLLFLLARNWPRYGLLALAAITICASWLSSIRSYAGLGIALSACAVLLLHRWRWWRTVLALGVLAIAYMSINNFVLGAIRAETNHRLGSATAKRIDITTSHTLWHTAYAGLGYLPNKYGLRFQDGAALDYVLNRAPHTVFLSSRYEAIVHEGYIDFIRDHPAEATRQYASKLLVTIADTAPYLLIACLTLPAALLLGDARQRRLVRRLCLLGVPPVLIEAVPVMMAFPLQPYEQGLYGAIGAIDILAVCWVIKLAAESAGGPDGASHLLAAARAPMRQLVSGREPVWRAARASAVALTVLIAISTAGNFVRRDAAHWQGGGSAVLMELF